MRDHLERETELRLALNHRVKNILASVMSIFPMTRRGASSLEAFSDVFKGRLIALSNVHSAVFLAGGKGVALADVARSTLAPYRSADAENILTNGPDIFLTREAGTTLALCLHELATNAVKYGAFSQAGGLIKLEWCVSSAPPRNLTITWTEAGGPPVVEPSHVGYGTRYVRPALSSVFGTPPQFVFAHDGLRCIIQGPNSKASDQQ